MDGLHKVYGIIFGLMVLVLTGCATITRDHAASNAAYRYPATESPKNSQQNFSTSPTSTSTSTPVKATSTASGSAGNTVNAGANASYHFSLAQAYSSEGNTDRAIEEYKLTLMYDGKSSLVNTRLATEYVRKGMLVEALEVTERAIALDHKNIEARLLKATLHNGMRNNALALKEYDTILKFQPFHEEAVLYKAQVLLEEERTTEAVQVLQGFTKKNTESALGWFYLGRAEQKRKGYDAAAKAFREALALRPSFTQAAVSLGYLYEEKGQNTKAVQVYKELFENSREPVAAQRLVAILLKDGKYSEAVPYLEYLQNADSEDLNSRVKLGLVYMEIKNFPGAITVFEGILKEHPESDRIYFYLGNIYEQMNMGEKAVEHYKKVQVNSKLYRDSILHATFLLRQAGKSDEAKDVIEAAIKASPKNSAFYIFQANLEEEANNVPKAIQILEKAVSVFPEDEKALYYLGSLYDRTGKVDESIEKMEAILRVNSENADALNYLGYTWTSQGVRLEEAEKLIKRALSLRPNDAYIQDSWGWYLYTRGRYTQAVVELEKAAKMKSDEATILEHLADVYVKLNLREKALAHYKKALELSVNEQDKAKLQNKYDNLHTEIAQGKWSVPNSNRIPASR